MSIRGNIKALRRMRCLRYAHTGDQHVAKLRGLCVFEGLRAVTRLARLFGGHGRVHIGAEVVTPCRYELLFLLMPPNSEIAEYVEYRRRRPNLPTIVDVHADVLGLLNEADEAMRRAAREASTPEAWEWWSDPQRQDALTRSVVAADVVTTSWPLLVEPLRQLNPECCSPARLRLWLTTNVST